MARLLFLAVTLSGVIAPFGNAMPVVEPRQASGPVSGNKEVVPGPGLPSLASLGLTSEQLYAKRPAPFAKANFVPLTTPVCNDFAHPGPVDDVIACFNYLTALGSRACVAPPSGVEMCHAGGAHIVGRSLTKDQTSSSCHDAALGVQWDFTYCNRGGQVDGSAPAYGNGDLLMTASGF